MENASKALIMAGSVLLSLIIIGSLVFMYNKLSDAEQTQLDAEEESKIVEYGNKFEQYNKKIYGSELFSLANLQEDYNTTQATEKGYNKINIDVTIKRPIAASEYFQTANTIADITRDKNAIEQAIKRYEEQATYKGRTVKYYSQLSNREIATIYGIEFSSYEIDYDIGERLKLDPTTSKLMKAIDEYRNTTSAYTEFKNKQFECKDIKYDNVGRISYMRFEEII